MLQAKSNSDHSFSSKQDLNSENSLFSILHATIVL